MVWIHFDRIVGWQEKKIGRFVRSLFNVFPIKLWGTTYTSEIADGNRKCGLVVDILPLPLNPALHAFACNHSPANKINVLCERSDKLMCWLLVSRPEQGLELLPSIIDHSSASNFPKKFIKCFVSERANITENSEIELVKLPFFVSDDNYQSCFDKCEVVLLPYSANSYSGRGADTLWHI
jgi:hypothetical protein